MATTVSPSDPPPPGASALPPPLPAPDASARSDDAYLAKIARFADRLAAGRGRPLPPDHGRSSRTFGE